MEKSLFPFLGMWKIFEAFASKYSLEFITLLYGQHETNRAREFVFDFFWVRRIILTAKL